MKRIVACLVFGIVPLAAPRVVDACGGPQICRSPTECNQQGGCVRLTTLPVASGLCDETGYKPRTPQCGITGSGQECGGLRAPEMCDGSGPPCPPSLQGNFSSPPRCAKVAHVPDEGFPVPQAGQLRVPLTPATPTRELLQANVGLPHALDAARAAYRKVNSVHLEAQVAITNIVNGEKVQGQARVSYWADGDKYRLRSITEPAAINMLAYADYAFDGVRAQNLIGDGLVINAESDDNALLTPVPNPFFLPVDYLDPRSDTCPQCALRLINMQQDLPIYYAKRVFAQDLTLETAPSEIKWRGREGRLAVQITFDRTVGSESPEWPSSILLQRFDPEGHESQRLQYTISTLELNVPIAPSIFQIPTELAYSVFEQKGGRLYPRH
jgi:hypothetical protein